MTAGDTMTNGCVAEDCPWKDMAQGTKMPTMGLGTWKSEAGKTGEAVKTAIRAGYRMIDCANDYGNEGEIGKAIKELIDAGEIKRTFFTFSHSIFVVSSTFFKFFHTQSSIEK
jgi:diketogulonate reductase-like aldo/keto reductase